MWYLFEGFGKVKQYDVNLVAVRRVTGQVLNCGYKLGFTRSPITEPVLGWCVDGVPFKVVHDVGMEDMFQHFGTDRREIRGDSWLPYSCRLS